MMFEGVRDLIPIKVSLGNLRKRITLEILEELGMARLLGEYPTRVIFARDVVDNMGQDLVIAN